VLVYNALGLKKPKLFTLSLLSSSSRLSQSCDSGTGSDGSHSAEDISTTSHDLFASLALPDTSCLSLNSSLTAESAAILGMLSDFHLLDDLSQGGTISGTVFTANSDLLSMLSLFV
jgi:hypothetical protein